MYDFEYQQWLAAFAWDVDKAIRQHGATARFQEMLNAWMADMEAQDGRLTDWEKRCARYIEKVRRTPELQDSRACDTNPVNGETAEGLKWHPLLVFGQQLWCWAPPEFRKRCEYTFPVPLPSDRALSVPERYAVLAAVHDLCCKGAEKVSPWPKPGPRSEAEDKFPYHTFGTLLERVSEIEETELLALKALLDGVEGDIALLDGRKAETAVQEGEVANIAAVAQVTVILPNVIDGQPPPVALSEITDGQVAEDAKAPRRKRKWVQGDVDKAIRQYKAAGGRAAQYAELKRAIAKGGKGAKKAVQELFGRNVIAKHLDCSRWAVSNSEVWLAIAEELKIPLYRNRATGTSRTRKPGRVGQDMGVEEASARQRKTLTPIEELKQRDREETLRRIRHLAEAGKKKEAEALEKDYEDGKMTDEQVRETAQTLLKPVD